MEIETEGDAALLQEYNDEQFEMFCLRSGVKVPGKERAEREAAEQAEIERRKDAQEKALMEERGR